MNDMTDHLEEEEEVECTEYHPDDKCDCKTFTVSSPDIRNGWEYTLKGSDPMLVAESFVNDHDSESMFALDDMTIEVTVTDEDGEEYPFDIKCEIEFKYISV